MKRSTPYYLKSRVLVSLGGLLLGIIFTHYTLSQEPKVDDLGNPIKEEVAESLLIDKEKEKFIVTRLYNAAEDLPAAQAAFAELPKIPTELELRALRNLDRELSRSSKPEHEALVAKAVELLAISGEATSLQYLHKVFDSQPERRALIATSIAKLALAGPRRPHDWPMLVRSLPVLEGGQIRTVSQALLKYRDRALNPSVQRNLLLAAIRLDGDGGEQVLDVLAYWSAENPASEAKDLPAKFAAWQTWYAKKYPNLPPPTLASDDPAQRHKYRELVDYLRPSANHPGDAKRGAVIFEKALCIKCHLAGEKGEKVGPNLTKVVQRLTMREIIESMLFPNQQVFDQYVTKQLVLTNGKVVSGLVGEQADAYIVLPSNAEKITIPRKEVAEIHDSPLSAMPAGLLEKFSPDEIADLLAFLKKLAED